MRGGFVYIVTNKPNGILYVGVTSDLVRRVHEHRVGVIKGFATLRTETSRLLRATRGYAKRYTAREDNQALVASMESKNHPRIQSRLG